VISPVPPHLAEPCVVAVLVTPIAKNGRRHYAKVTEPVAFAARLLVGKGISERHYYAAVTRACRELNSLHSSFHEKVAPRQCPSRSSFPEAAAMLPSALGSSDLPLPVHIGVLPSGAANLRREFRRGTLRCPRGRVRSHLDEAVREIPGFISLHSRFTRSSSVHAASSLCEYPMGW